MQANGSYACRCRAAIGRCEATTNVFDNLELSREDQIQLPKVEIHLFCFRVGKP